MHPRFPRADADGQVLDLLPPPYNLRTGWYRLVFDVAPYLASRGGGAVWQGQGIATVPFEVRDPSAHYHIPMELSPRLPQRQHAAVGMGEPSQQARTAM